MLRVSLVTVACSRFWSFPWPSWMSEYSLSRIQGMPRCSADLTRACVDGPRARRCAKRMNASRSAGKSKPAGTEPRGLRSSGSSAWRTVRARRPADDGWRQASRLGPDLGLRVLEDDLVLPGVPRRPRLPEGDFDPRDVLELDRHVLQHVTEPGPLLLGQTAYEAARLPVRAAVL